MMMSIDNNLSAKRMKSLLLVAVMLLSISAAAMTASASLARTYTTNRDPVDIAMGDFDCDDDNDLAIATDGTHSFTVLWNDDGDFSERDDIWVAGNQSEQAEWDDFANVRMIEVGDFNGDGADDIVLFQRNNPFKRDDNGAPAGEPGNVTVLENNGCSDDGFSVTARFSHFWAWDLHVADLDYDGNDDVVVLDLMADITTQRLVTYRGPITSSQQQGQVTNLGSSTAQRYTDFRLGDYGESETGVTGSCEDVDAWFRVDRGADYSTGQYTTQGHEDNITVMEFSCLTNTFPATATPQTMNGPWVMGNSWGGFDIADLDGDNRIDTIAQTEANIENMTWRTSPTMGNWNQVQKAYFGPFISWEVFVDDLNGDGEPDFIASTIAEQLNSTSSTGAVEGNYYLAPPSTVQVVLSDGNNGHLNPLSYNTARRPSTSSVGQLIGGASSPLDVVVGHDSYNFGNWVDNSGWSGQYDRITIIEMDHKDLEVSSIDINPTDRYVGAVGEGTRDVNVTVTNTGMDVLNGQASLTVELQTVDTENSTNNTVYSYDWDGAEFSSGCGGGCTWTYEDYLDNGLNWHLETNHSNAAPSTSMGTNDVNWTANWTGNNPTNFMWMGTTETNTTGSQWSGIHRNWDEAMTLNDVDLTNSDRAWLSVELFRHLGFGALGYLDANGQWLLGDVWDDMALIEVNSEDSGWRTINCPTSAFLDGACWSGSSIWGGYDNERASKIYTYGANAESNLWYGLRSSGTYYGWTNFTEEGVGAFDLSPWAGDTIDIRFRMRTGFDGSISDSNESRWSGRDGYAVDNVTIWKQTTAFSGSPQTQQTNIPMTNLQPGEEYETSIQANFDNDTVYRVSAVLSYSQDEQPVNDELTGFIQTLNIFDPAMVSIDSFEPGALYAEGTLPINATVAHYGNTAVDFDVQATVLSAEPNDVDCGATPATCEEDFEGGATGYRYSDDDGDGNGAIQNDLGLQEVLFGSSAYWFGNPDVSANLGYEDVWNESFSIDNVDLTQMQGDFAALNFDYFAETFFYIDSDGDKYSVNDYVAVTMDWDRSGQAGSGFIVGQWSDYNEDGTCFVDEDGDGFIDPINETQVDNKEIDYIGDPANVDGTSGGDYNVFFDSDGLVKSRSIDLTHLFILNQTGASQDWDYECMSLKGTTVDLNFEFQSDDDGHNGMVDGLRGVAFDNISIEEFSFVQDAVYSNSVTGIDAEENQVVTIGTHDFDAGVYMVEVETLFDNTSAGTSWFGEEEFNDANNIERVIFTVESVDIVLGKPDSLACLNDITLACVMPIDSALTHKFNFSATNGVLAGDYRFNMQVVDLANGQQVYSTQANGGQLTSLQPHQRIEVSFSGWNGWTDSGSYNISFDAELSDGSPSGNVRFFHATFQDQIDVAILSDPTEQGRLDNVKRDLGGMGMSYTMFTTSDWNTYFTSAWLLHYDKILVPWQSEISAKDLNAGGNGFYQLLGSSANKQTLETFMYSGGTVQMHLGPYQNYYQVDRLPFKMDVFNREAAGSQVTFNDLQFADPYHPLLDNVNTDNFAGFEADQTVARAVLNTNKVGDLEIPERCGGRMHNGGQFQSIIEDASDSTASLLAVCGYENGGLIVTTVDVEFQSSPWNSSTMPLLSNMLSYQVTPYPSNFDNIDITINGEIPALDPATSNSYAIRYMKSDATLNFGYLASGVTETLDADWELDGPTGWDGSALVGGPDHSDSESPSADFCKLISGGDCEQNVVWDLKLYLHDDAGHARVATIRLMTDDLTADEHRPIAIATVQDRTEYADQLSYRGNKTIAGKVWDIFEVKLGSTGDVIIYFDGSNSSDQDALEGTGIDKYEWSVNLDYPTGPSSDATHTFEEPSNVANAGEWSYRFRNDTTANANYAEHQIRVELVVYDMAGKISEKFRIYFVVVPEGYGDAAPDVIFDTSLNHSKQEDDWVFIGGMVQSGAESSDVKIQVALNNDDLNATSLTKYTLKSQGKWNQSCDVVYAPCSQPGLGDGDAFNIGLRIDDLYTNVSRTLLIYIKIEEGDGSTHTIYKYVELNLPACQGEQPPDEALQAGGEWVLDADGVCQWDGEYEFNSDTGEWNAPASSGEGESTSSSTLLYVGGGLGGLIILVLLTVLVLRRGGSDEGESGFQAAAGGFGGVAQMDPMEQYVQQLIAQGYPEPTARAYAQQYAAHFQQQQQGFQ